MRPDPQAIPPGCAILDSMLSTSITPVTISARELTAWIRLSVEPGLGPAQARNLLKILGLPHDIFSMSAGSLSKLLAPELAQQIARTPGPETESAIARALDWLAGPQHYLLTLADPAYPPALLDIHDPPLVLYVNGKLESLCRPAIAIVGARNASAAGTDNASAFARHLSMQGWCIVSGLASGIDAAAHKGALSAGPGYGGTIAVLGTGIDIVYPSANRDLAHAIAQQGALVSEFPLGTRALPYQFPKRNRIVAGLARGVLVVEAARHSGSLITAKLAGDMGREVFAIPGSIHSPLSRGCHALIRQGAKLVESAQDIQDELGLPARFKDAAPATPVQVAGMAQNDVAAAPLQNPITECSAMAQTKESTMASDHARSRLACGQDSINLMVLDALGYDPVHIDTLQERTQLDLATLNSRLLAFELNETIARLDDGRFQRR